MAGKFIQIITDPVIQSGAEDIAISDIMFKKQKEMNELLVKYANADKLVVRLKREILCIRKRHVL